MKLPFSKEENMNVSSLNEGRNMLFFAFMLVAPFYIVAGAAFIVDLMGLGPEYTLMTLGMGMAAWGSLTAVHWSNLKSTLAELKLFSSIVRFSHTVAYQLDMLFDEDKIKYVGTTNKGRDIYQVFFNEDFGYNHPTEGPITFNKAFIVLPFGAIPWKETFSFKNKTQVWFRGLALTCSNSEFTVFDVSPFWDWMEGEWIPTFLVADSWQHGVQANAQMLKLEEETMTIPVVEGGKTVEREFMIKATDDPIIGNELIQARLIEAKGAITGLNLARARITVSRDQLLDEKKDFDKELQTRREADQRIDRDFFTDEPPLKWRIKNLKPLAYVVAALGIIAIMVWLLG